MAGNQPPRKDAGNFDFNGWLARGAQFLGSEAKTQGGEYARQAGNAAGVARAGLQSLKGSLEDFHLAGRILSPFDRVFNSSRPLQPMINGVNNIVDYVFDAPSHPERVVKDLGNQLNKWNEELNPYATPPAATFGGELNRNFQIGMNQGNAAVDLAPLAFGAGVVKAVPRLLPISEGEGTAKFMEQGFSARKAARLAEPYNGMGHHFVPRSWAVPEKLGDIPMPDFLVGQKLPTWLSDSRLNVLKPINMNKGDFYELHYKVDPDFHGAAIFRGSPGWSGGALGLQKYGLLGRLWHGSPAPLNAAVGTVGAVELAKKDQADGEGP